MNFLCPVQVRLKLQPNEGCPRPRFPSLPRRRVSSRGSLTLVEMLSRKSNEAVRRRNKK